MKRISTIFIILFFSQNILSAINNPFLLINKDLHDGFLTDVKAVELKARTLLIPESLPARYQFEEPDYIPCGLAIIDDAQEYYDQLPGDLQIKLDNINNDIDERSNVTKKSRIHMLIKPMTKMMNMSLILMEG